MALWTCRCAWTTPRRCPHAHSRATAKNKPVEPRSKVDHAASPMPETRQPERLPPRATSSRNGGRDHLGILGEIKSVHPGEIIGIRTLKIQQWDSFVEDVAYKPGSLADVVKDLAAFLMPKTKAAKEVEDGNATKVSNTVSER